MREKILNKENFKIYLLKEKYSALKMLSNYWIIWGNTLKSNENHDIMPHCGYNFVKIVYMQRKKSEMKHTQMLIVASQCGEKASDIYFLRFLFFKFPKNMYCIYNWKNKCFLSHSSSRLLSPLFYSLLSFRIFKINCTFCGLSHFIFF